MERKLFTEENRNDVLKFLNEAKTLCDRHEKFMFNELCLKHRLGFSMSAAVKYVGWFSKNGVGYKCVKSEFSKNDADYLLNQDRIRTARLEAFKKWGKFLLNLDDTDLYQKAMRMKKSGRDLYSIINAIEKLKRDSNEKNITQVANSKQQNEQLSFTSVAPSYSDQSSAVDRIITALNTFKKYSEEGTKVSTHSICSNHKTDTGLMTWAKKLNYFTQINQGLYVCNIKEEFTRYHAEKLIALRASKGVEGKVSQISQKTLKVATNKAVPDFFIPSEGASALKDPRDKKIWDLLDANVSGDYDIRSVCSWLRSRGWSGKICRTKEITL